MEQFNINNVISHYKLDVESTAKILFPNAKYPKLAFDRIIKGESALDTTQLERLASYIGVIVSDLFLAEDWKGITEDGCLVLHKGDYKAKLNYKGVYLSLYKNDELIAQKISNIPDMTIQEFINYLDNLIKNYENGNY